MKKAEEMTREELEQAYRDAMQKNTELLVQTFELKEQYDKKKTYGAEYAECLEKSINLRFANRILCALAAPLLPLYARASLSNIPTEPKTFLLDLVINIGCVAVACFFARGISEEELTRFLGVGITKSKLVTPLFALIAAVLLMCAKL